MHISKKNTILIIIGIFCFLFWLYFFIILPRYSRENMIYLDKNVISAFQNDKQVIEISHKRILLDDNRPVCDIESTRPLCREKIRKYAEIMERMPKGTYYNMCNGFIIKHYSSSLHYVLLLSRPDIIYSGVQIKYRFQDWGEYYLNRNHFNDRTNCYPWNDLGDYWKRYGKASSESIQGVIDGQNLGKQ